MAGMGTLPSQSGTHIRMFCTADQSKKVSHNVNFLMPQRVSCAMPMTGLLACGEMIYQRMRTADNLVEGDLTYLAWNPGDLAELGLSLFALGYTAIIVKIGGYKSPHSKGVRTAYSFRHNQNRHHTGAFFTEVQLQQFNYYKELAATYTERFNRNAAKTELGMKTHRCKIYAYLNMALALLGGSSCSSCVNSVVD